MPPSDHLVIVNNLDHICLAIIPPEADPPLRIDPDAPLTCTIPLKGLKPASRWVAQVIQRHRCIKLTEFPQGPILDISWNPAAPLTPPDMLGLAVAK